MSKTAITIEIDEGELARYTDHRLALCWHLAQANPAPYGDHRAGELAEHIGREIIRRWLASVEPELWHHQGGAYFAAELGKFARYIPGGPAWDWEKRDWNPRFYQGRWVPQHCEHDPAPPGQRCDAACRAGKGQPLDCVLAAGHDREHWDPAVGLHWSGEGTITGWCRTGKTGAP